MDRRRFLRDATQLSVGLGTQSAFSFTEAAMPATALQQDALPIIAEPQRIPWWSRASMKKSQDILRLAFHVSAQGK
jgi:hypothetical protein